MARRSARVERHVLWGAFVGVVASLGMLVGLSQLGDGEVSGIARMALLLPTVCFVLWWVVMPTSTELPPPNVHATIEADERLERIDATFDVAAVPKAGRRPVSDIDRADRERFRASIRRDDDDLAVGREYFGIRSTDPGPQSGRQTS